MQDIHVLFEKAQTLLDAGR
jgi:hypothetical protein